MRNEILRVVIVFFLLTLVAQWSFGDDVEDVREAYRQHITNSNTGNLEGFVEQHLPGHSAFGPGGALLSRYDSLEEEKRLVKASRAPSGRRGVRSFTNVQVRHLEVRIYEGQFAVVTGYLVGTETASAGTPRQEARRVTAVWLKQNGQWREAHDHMSQLRVAPPQ